MGAIVDRAKEFIAKGALSGLLVLNSGVAAQGVSPAADEQNKETIEAIVAAENPSSIPLTEESPAPTDIDKGQSTAAGADVKNPRQPAFRRGYNAVQLGMSPDSGAGIRTYHNVGFTAGGYHLSANGLNQYYSSQGLFGSEVLQLGHEASPVSAIYRTRIAGQLEEIVQLDRGFGLRASPSALGLPLYGRLDLVKHTGGGLLGYRGWEFQALLGKRLGGGSDVTGFLSLREGKRYAELEYIGLISEKFPAGNLSYFIRGELNGGRPGFRAGLHLQP